MTTLTINVDSEVERAFRQRAKEQRHGKKGFLGGALTEAMKIWLEEQQQKEITERALQKWRKGHVFGRLLYRQREELHAR